VEFSKQVLSLFRTKKPRPIMEMSSESRQEDIREIREYFSGFGVTIQEMESQMNLGGMTGRQIAETVVMSLATARASFTSFRNAYEDDMKQDNLPLVFTKAYVQMAKEINLMWKGLSPEVDFPLSGKTIIDWMNGEGRDPTKADFEGMAAFLTGVQRAMRPLREIMTGYARRDDPFDGQTFAFVSWMHYLQGVLSSCDCPYMDMGYEEGIDLSGLDDRFEEIVSRMDEASERAGKFQQADDAKMSENTFEEEISDDLQKMMEDTGTMMQ